MRLHQTPTHCAVGRSLTGALCGVTMVVVALPCSGDLLDRLAVHGFQTWTWRDNSVSGGTGGNNAFSLDNFGYDTSFDNNTSLSIDGEIIDNFRIHANLTKSRFMPKDSRYYLQYDGKRTDVTLGDLTTSLSGNEFATLSRTMRGLQIDTSFGNKFRVGLLASQTDAQVYDDAFPGNNTVGPYYLDRSPIVDGSEQVWVDEQLKQRGVDYIIDYSFGVLTFQGVNVIPNTSTIAVSYEYDAPGQRSGTVIGLRGTAPLSETLSLGSTLLFQLGSGGGGGVQTGEVTQREEFLGSNSAGPYQLIFRPIVQGSEIVTVAAAPLVRNVDYELNYDSGLITFARPISSASLIVVDYRYEQTINPPSPDHKIFGIDGAWKFNDTAGVNFEMAYSSGGRTQGDDSPESGLAFNLRGAGQFGKLNAAVGLRSVGDGFRRFDNIGFQRNESGLDLTLNYVASPHVMVQSRFSDYSSDSPLNFGVVGAFNQGVSSVATQNNKSKTSQFLTTLNLAYPKWPELRLNFQKMSNDSGTSTNSSSMASVDLAHRVGKLVTQAQASLSRQSFVSGSAALTGTAPVLGDSENETRTGRLSLQYLASQELQGGVDLAATAVLTGRQTTSISDTANFGLSWTPSARLMVSLNHYLSNSEGGFAGGFGSFGGGFYSGFGGFGGYGSLGGGYGGYGSSFGGSSFGGFGSISSNSYGSYASSSSFSSSAFGNSYGGSSYYSTPSFSTGWGGSNSSSYYNGYTSSTGVNYGASGMDTTFGAGSGSVGLFDGLGSSASGGLFGPGIGGPGGPSTMSTPHQVTTLDTNGDVLHTETATRSLRAPLPHRAVLPLTRQFSTTSEAGKSRSAYTTLTSQYAFNDKLSINANYNHQVSDGTGFVSNSTSDDLSLGFSYRANDSLFFLGQWSGQTLSFLDAGGDTTSDIFWLGVQWGGLQGLNVGLDYQRMDTASPSSFGDPTTTAGLDPTATLGAAALTTGGIQSNTSTVTLNVTYPVLRKLNARAQYQIVNSGGNDLYASDRNSLRLGLEYWISRFMSLTAEMEKIDSSSGNSPGNDYSATILSSQLSLRF